MVVEKDYIYNSLARIAIKYSYVVPSLSLRHETITGKWFQKINPNENPRILPNITTF